MYAPGDGPGVIHGLLRWIFKSFENDKGDPDLRGIPEPKLLIWCYQDGGKTDPWQIVPTLMTPKDAYEMLKDKGDYRTLKGLL